MEVPVQVAQVQATAHEAALRRMAPALEVAAVHRAVDKVARMEAHALVAQEISSPWLAVEEVGVVEVARKAGHQDLAQAHHRGAQEVGCVS